MKIIKVDPTPSPLLFVNMLRELFFLETRCLFSRRIQPLVSHEPSQKITQRALKATFTHDYLDKRPFYKFNVSLSA